MFGVFKNAYVKPEVEDVEAKPDDKVIENYSSEEEDDNIDDLWNVPSASLSESRRNSSGSEANIIGNS
jgi:hypothetical protein